jgi:hypothetical protein
MTSSPYLGRTVALTSCPAFAEGSGEVAVAENPISGLFIVAEFWPVEPSAYVWSPTFLVCRAGGDADAPSWTVDADVLVSQVDPHAYGRQLELERDMEFAEET